MLVDTLCSTACHHTIITLCTCYLTYTHGSLCCAGNPPISETTRQPHTPAAPPSHNVMPAGMPPGDIPMLAAAALFFDRAFPLSASSSTTASTITA